MTPTPINKIGTIPLANPMTTQGDTIYGGASGVATRLPKGTGKQFYTMDDSGTNPQWRTVETNKKIYYVSTVGISTNTGLTPDSAVDFATALTKAGSSGNTIGFFSGTYAGDSTISNLNTDFVGVHQSPGGLINFTGTWTFSGASAGSSNRLQGITVANLVQSGVTSLYTKDVKVTTATTLSSNGYFEATDTDTQGPSSTGTVSVTGTGSKIFQGIKSKVGFLTVNNSAAVVTLNNCFSVAPITLTAGTIASNDSQIYSAGSSTFAINATAGSIVYCNNVSFLNPDGTPAKINFPTGVFYSLINCTYNKATSVLTGTRLSRTAYFDLIETTTLSGTNTGDETTTRIGTLINGATEKTTPVDADMVGLMDSTASNVLKKLSWLNIKATLKTYFDTLYANIAGAISQSFSVSQLEIGHASDTTLTRVSAGVVAVEGVKIKMDSMSTNKLLGRTTASAGAIEEISIGSGLNLNSGILSIGTTINAQTGTTYTFALTDASILVTFTNSSPITATIPPNSSVPLPIGTQIDIAQHGAGKLTIAQGSGVTINSFGGNKSLAGQYVGGALIKTGTDTWSLYGNLIA